MVWILVLVGLVAASVYGAHRLLGGVEQVGPLGRVHALPRALVYAAAVVVGSQATNAAINIHQITGRQFGLPFGDKAQAIVQVLSTHVADVAWQAGLLLAASALLASRARAYGTSAKAGQGSH
jgi:hypothetical protein